MSQVEVTSYSGKLMEEFGTVETVEDLYKLSDFLKSHLTFRPYNDETKSHEWEIRWTRTGGEVLEDAYVYRGKACTDMVLAFMVLCRTAGLEVEFVKVTKDGSTHSLVEVCLDEVWYICDVSVKEFVIQEGRVTEESGFGEWSLQCRGLEFFDKFQKGSG